MNRHTLATLALVALGIRAEAVAAKSGPSKDAVAAAVTAHVKSEAKKSDGLFKVDDPVEDKELSLTLTRVHRNRVIQVGPDAWATCADFISTDAHTYDVDVIVTGPDADHLVVTEVSVHKKDGAERYTWQDGGGSFKRQPATPPPGAGSESGEPKTSGD